MVLGIHYVMSESLERFYVVNAFVMTTTLHVISQLDLLPLPCSKWFDSRVKSSFKKEGNL